LDYCLENNIKTVYYGDLDSCTRNTRGRVGRVVGQKLGQWEYGKIILQLHNKLERHGIQLVKVDERYSTQTCPACNKKNKPSSRNYKCKWCGYVQHRDVVGAMNILNFNTGTSISTQANKKYLRIE
jgi:putative transposase